MSMAARDHASSYSCRLVPATRSKPRLRGSPPTPAHVRNPSRRRNISLGERILAEKPLVESYPGAPPLLEAFAALSPAQQDAYMSLSQNTRQFGESKSVEGVYSTNSMPTDHRGNERTAVFLLASRFNHVIIIGVAQPSLASCASPFC